MTTYARATSGYDDAHEAALRDPILHAIAETSKISDADAIIIRTGELTAALLDVLGLTLCLSPPALRSKSAIRRLTDELGRRLRRRVATHVSAEMKDLLRRAFHGTDVGGRA